MTKANFSYTAATLLFLTYPSLAATEDDPIAPDRPGLSTGTHTVAPGTLYLEAGYQYEFNRSGLDTSTQTIPQLVLRTGLTDKLELDLLWDGLNQDRIQGFPSETSSADVAIGGKYRLLQSEKLNLTLLGLVSLSVGSEPSTSDNADPLLGLLWDYGISDTIQLFGVFQTTRLEDDDGSSFQENQIGLGVGFGHSDKLSTFVEYFAALPDQSGLDDQHIVDAGITYLYSDDIQLDISAGVGLNDETSHFISFGIATRF